MKQQTAVQFLINYMLENFHLTDYTVMVVFEQAKQMERQKLIGFLDWMNEVAKNNPMAFETDHDDIVDMYLNGYYGGKL